MNLSVRSLLLLLSLFVFAGCGKSSSSPKVLRVGFVPAENAQQVIQNAQPIVELLQNRLGMEVQPFVATDYT
jgi:ABC-type phosphate/phosphonate transport system substrate-binding protein